VTDFFSEFGLDRRAWIDLDVLKSKYHALMAESHPDKTNGSEARSTLLNEGRKTLSSHPHRLRHLAALLGAGTESPTKVSPDWDLFSRTGDLTRRASVALEKKTSLASPIAKAVLQGELKQLESDLIKLRKEINAHLEQLDIRTRQADQAPHDAASLLVLAEEWTFATRWSQSINTAITALSLR
jgi:DnaJ-domain-containing protein 1